MAAQFGTGGAAGASALEIRAETTADWSSAGNRSAAVVVYLANAGSLSERFRVQPDGEMRLSGTAVISAARHPLLRSYTVATVPTASPAAQLIVVSDGASNKRLAVSDGTNWRCPTARDRELRS